MSNISCCNSFIYYKGLEKLIEISELLQYDTLSDVGSNQSTKIKNDTSFNTRLFFFTQLYYSENKSKQQIVTVYHYLVYTF